MELGLTRNARSRIALALFSAAALSAGLYQTIWMPRS